MKNFKEPIKSPICFLFLKNDTKTVHQCDVSIKCLFDFDGNIEIEDLQDKSNIEVITSGFCEDPYQMIPVENFKVIDYFNFKFKLDLLYCQLQFKEQKNTLLIFKKDEEIEILSILKSFGYQTTRY